MIARIRREALTREKKGTGLFAKSTTHPVSCIMVTIELTPEELATVNKYDLWNQVVHSETIDHSPEVAKVMGQSSSIHHYTMQDFLSQNGWTREHYLPSVIALQEHELKETILPLIKRMIDGNVDVTAPTNETLEF